MAGVGCCDSVFHTRIARRPGFSRKPLTV
jgi:hypothetical protein